MTRQEAPALVTRRVDGLLVGWLAVLVWLGVRVGGAAGIGRGSVDLGLVTAVGVVVTAAHFGVSYHLAYGRGVATAVRHRPWMLGALPVALAAVLAAVVVTAALSGEHAVVQATSALVTSVYLLTTWHYVKQVYGVGRVGAAFAGLRLSGREAGVLRYGLYPVWFLGAAQVLLVGRQYDLGGFPVGYHLLPLAADDVLRDLALVSALPVAAVLVRSGLRARRLPPSLLVAPYAAAYLWLALPTSPVLTVVLLAPFHALQYLAVAHRAEVSLTRDRGAVWWLSTFGGAAAGGLLVSRWLPQLLDQHLLAGGPALFTAAAFVFLNLHHYLIDAAIWRSKGEVVGAVVRGPAPRATVVPAAAVAPEPATA